MLSKLLHPLTLGFGLLSAATAQIIISGPGTISVVVGDNFYTDPANATVGCLNAAGKLTLADCATYTGGNDHVATGEGVCSFHNTSAPVNPRYWDDYAFTCWEHEDNNRDPQFWTLVGFIFFAIHIIHGCFDKTNHTVSPLPIGAFLGVDSC